MPKNFNHLGSLWIKTPLTMLIDYSDYFYYPFCLLINSSKKVVIEYERDSIRDRLQNFAQREVTHIYIKEEDIVTFMNDVKASIQNKVVNTTAITPDAIEDEILSLASCFELMKNSFISLGFSRSNIELAKQINLMSIKLIDQTPNLISLLKKMENSLNEHFANAILSASLSSCLIDAYTWGSSSIKQKVSLGCMLKQLNWEKEHFDIYKSGEKLERLKELPLKMSALMQENGTFSKEVIEIVEQSFETPNSKGFPRGIGAGSIGRLSALSIVSHGLIKKLTDYKFDYTKKASIIDELKHEYCEGQFVQIMEGVSRMIAA